MKPDQTRRTIMATDDFSPDQWAFLATVHALEGPMEVDVLVAACPLAPGRLLEVLERAEALGLIAKTSTQVVAPSPNAPSAALKRIETLNNPARLNEVVERLEKQGSLASIPAAVRARLFRSAGLEESAASLELELAETSMKEGRLEAAHGHLWRGLEATRPFLDIGENKARFLALALDFSGISFALGKDFAEVSRILETAARLAEDMGDERSRALVNLHLGRLYYLGDRRMDAMAAFEAGRSKVEELGDDDIRIQSAEFIGLYYFIRGLHAEAIEYLDRAAGAFDALAGERLVNPSAPLYLGFCAAYLGQFHRAIGGLDFSWRRAKRDANPVLASTYRSALGAVLLMTNKQKEARYHLKAALEEAVAGGNALAKYSASGGLAYDTFCRGHWREARDILAGLIEEGAAHGLKRQFASPYILEMLFEFERQGLPRIPDFGFQDQVARLLSEPSIHLQGVALRLRAMDALMKGDEAGRVESDLEKSEACLIRSGDPIQLAKTRAELARFRLGRGQRREARILAQKARKGLSGHSEDLFPDGLRSLLDDLAPLDSDLPPRRSLTADIAALVESPLLPSFDENLVFLVTQMNRILGAERGGLFWTESGKGPLKLTAVRNLTAMEAEGRSFKPSLALVETSHRTGAPLVRKMGVSDGPPPARAVTAVLCLPLRVGLEAAGVLYHDNAYLDDCFDGLGQEDLSRAAADLNAHLERVQRFARLMEETNRTAVERSVQREMWGGEEIVSGQSRAMAQALETADRAALSDSTVLIQGETGVGKELLARRIHEQSPRAKKPFVTVDPTTIPENLMESELFGYEKGAFTGAVSRKPGRVELAHQGTLFIDEIGEIPLPAQAKLLRLLQEKTFVRIGGTKPLAADFRLVAATNRDLEEEIAAGRFRRDLYYRLNIINLKLPALRDRQEDVIPLTYHFTARFAKKYNRANARYVSRDLQRLVEYHWPGNVRELKNLIERAFILSRGPYLELEVPSGMAVSTEHPFRDGPSLEEVQRRYIRHVLEKTGGRIGGPGGAAEILGMKRTSLYTRMKKLGLGAH
jgi:transcriptional regulator with GAF, ATPase, and Fis domain/tetratricopeptide (TPR) repeat protein